MAVFDRFRHPAWITSLATLIAYGLLLVGVAVILFGIPYLVAISL